jgi:hypothetical protein
MADNKVTTSGTKATGDDNKIAPVIDLREIDASAAASASTTIAPSSMKNPLGVSLEDEAMMAESQTIAPPPPPKNAISDAVAKKFPDLEKLIKDTESMNEDERNYWFQILPIMTDDQIGKFRNILVNEKAQLKRLDTEYEDEINRLNQKHMIEWKEFETKEKRKALQTAEEAANKAEQVTEEELLKKLSA